VVKTTIQKTGGQTEVTEQKKVTRCPGKIDIKTFRVPLVSISLMAEATSPLNGI
jgi:hypothetical protein